MCATWAELGNSESEEEPDNEEVVVCFMAIKDNDDDEGSDTEVHDQNPSYDEIILRI